MESYMSEDRTPPVNASLSVASIVLDTYIDKPLDYHIPPAFLPLLRRGSRVEIRVRNRLQKGYVLDVKAKSSIKNIQPILGILPEDTWIHPEIFSLGLWLAKYYAASLDTVFRSLVPPSIRKDVRAKKSFFISLKKSKKDILACLPMMHEKHPSRAKALEYLLEKEKGSFLSSLLQEVKISRSPVQKLIESGFLKSEKREQNPDFLNEEFFPTLAKSLTDEQKNTFDSIAHSLEKDAFQVHLIYGVTGSGKTEIYMQLIQKALDLNKSALMLVPEVALTTQIIERFRSRFTCPIAILHHKRSLGERFEDWQKIQNNQAKIIIGARSSVFCPAQHLGLIIVDEEQDTSYKQTEEAPAYHARDVAIMRAKLQKSVVVLGSATPTVETFYHAQNQKYQLHTLKKRATGISFPKIHVVSMKTEMDKRGGFTHFSDALIQGIKKRIEDGEQTIVFLNKRGYYRSLLCTKCSYIAKCKHCDISLTYHKKEHNLRCHLCNYTCPPLTTCPECQSKETISYKGFGTEHVQKSLHALFENIRTLRMDRDTTKNKHSHEELLTEFRTGKADVLIGTQMIAKGLDFPNVTLVGILNIDSQLSIPDFRSFETAFQLITQVSGRSGRSDILGEVILQTFIPNHPIIQKAIRQDYLSFYQEEIESRKLFVYPPFCRMAKLIFSGKDEKKVERIAQDFRKKLLFSLTEEDKVHPLIPSAHAKVKDTYRFQFLIRTKQIQRLASILKDTKQKYSFPYDVKLFIDIDPVHTF